MRILKGLVIGMAVLIVAGMGLVAYGLYRKSMEPGVSILRVSGVAEPFGEVPLALPAACSLAEIRPDGARLYVRVGPAGGDCERILIFDSANGSLIGSIAVKR